MTSEDLDKESKRVYAAAPGASFEFQKHLMLWVKVLGAERTKECLVTAVDICDVANEAFKVAPPQGEGS